MRLDAQRDRAPRWRWIVDVSHRFFLSSPPPPSTCTSIHIRVSVVVSQNSKRSPAALSAVSAFISSVILHRSTSSSRWQRAQRQSQATHDTPSDLGQLGPLPSPLLKPVSQRINRASSGPGTGTPNPTPPWTHCVGPSRNHVARANVA